MLTDDEVVTFIPEWVDQVAFVAGVCGRIVQERKLPLGDFCVSDIAFDIVIIAWIDWNTREVTPDDWYVYIYDLIRKRFNECV